MTLPPGHCHCGVDITEVRGQVMTSRGTSGGGGMDLTRRGKDRLCPRVGFSREPALLFCLKLGKGQEDALYELLFFVMQPHLHALQYTVGAALIRTEGVSFGGSTQPSASPGWSRSLPAGGHIVHPLLAPKLGQGKRFLSFGTSVELEVHLPSCRESWCLAVTSSCPLSVGRYTSHSWHPPLHRPQKPH